MCRILRLDEWSDMQQLSSLAVECRMHEEDAKLDRTLRRWMVELRGMLCR